MADAVTDQDPTSDHAHVHQALRHAVDEAARLMGSDGAILYVKEPGTDTLRWAYDAGITREEDRAGCARWWCRSGRGCSAAPWPNARCASPTTTRLTTPSRTRGCWMRWCGPRLCLMAEEGTYLVPQVVAGESVPGMTAWLHTQWFLVGAGMNGLAAQLGRAIKTADYSADLSFLAAVRRRWPRLSILAMSGSDDLAPDSLRNGAITFVAKTGQPDDLLAALTRRVPQAGLV